jgi:hypothetical protein
VKTDAPPGTLWIAEAAEGGPEPRFFLVPDGATPPPGALPVRTVLGAAAQADPDAMARWEVSQADAEAHVRAHVLAFGATLAGSLAAARGGAPRTTSAISLDALLGLRPDEARDPDRVGAAVGEALRGFVAQVAEAAATPAAPNPLAEALRGPDTLAALDALAAGLRDAAADIRAETERLRAGEPPQPAIPRGR